MSEQKPHDAHADGTLTDTHTDRILCHTYDCAKPNTAMIPGWPYSVVGALDSGRSSSGRADGRHMAGF